MSVRLSRSGCTSALVFFCCAAVMVSGAMAQENQSSAPAPSPPSAIAPSPSTAKPDGLKQLEDELRRSLQSLSPGSAPDSSLAPQYRPPVVVVPDKRARDAEERRRSWLLLEPDSAQPGTSTKDWLNSSENPLDTKSKTRNSLDDFYERLNQGTSQRLMPRTAETDPAGLSRSEKNGSQTTAREDGNLPSGIKDSAKRLQDLLGGFNRTDERSSPTESGGLSTFFGNSDKQLSPEDIKAHKAYMDEYRKVLGPTRVPSTAPTPLAPLGSSSAPVGSGPLGGFNDLGDFTHPKGFDSPPGMLTTTRNPGTLPDFNANALNQWNALYAAPKVEPPKPAPLSVPQAEAPRRRF